jgi:hypothetical protein
MQRYLTLNISKHLIKHLWYRITQRIIYDPMLSWLSYGSVFFFYSYWGETEYCGHYWSIVPAPDDRWWWLWRNWWNEYWPGKPKYWEKTCPSATLSTTNFTWLDPGSNPGRRGGKPATNRLSYGAASVCVYAVFVFCVGNGLGRGWSIPPSKRAYQLSSD